MDFSWKRSLFERKCNHSTAVVPLQSASQTWHCLSQHIQPVVSQVCLDRPCESSPDLRTSALRLIWQPDAKRCHCQCYSGNLEDVQAKCAEGMEIRQSRTSIYNSKHRIVCTVVQNYGRTADIFSTWHGSFTIQNWPRQSWSDNYGSLISLWNKK